MSKIFNVEPRLLQSKFRLEPDHQCHPDERENLVFFSPSVLLEDLALRQGGWKDRGAKEVLGLIAKDILTSKDYSLFQVPEITYFHIGYGKKSDNKKGRMAITKPEAQNWMNFFDLAEWKANRRLARNREDVNAMARSREGEADMEVEDVHVDRAFSFPTEKDFQALEFNTEDCEEDVIDPSDSGLKIRGVKSRYLLFFSILLMYYKKENHKSNTKRKTGSVGPNKISDFLLFWILPYLMNFTQQQLNNINEHHKAQSKTSGVPEFSVPTVSMSAMEIIQAVFGSCHVPEAKQGELLDKYRSYYGTDKLERKYSLPAVESRDNEPIILVPLHYQKRKMSLKLSDIGRKWREIGDVCLVEEFIQKFIESREIQEDFLNSIREQEEIENYKVDYAIILPDQDTFTELLHSIEEKHPDLFKKCTEKQGKDFVTPRLGFVNNADKTFTVCFSYFQGE